MDIRVSRPAVAITYLVLLIGLLHADAPYEKWHVDYDDSLRVVLTGVQGILTVTAGVKKGDKFVIYSKGDVSFKLLDTLDVPSETVPVSNYGYHPPVYENDVMNYRFPVIDIQDGYVCVVYDAIRNLRAWLKLDEIEMSFFRRIVMFTDGGDPSLQNLDFVDIYGFTTSGNRKLYANPRKDADYRILSRDHHRWYLRILSLENGFIRVARVNVDQGTADPIGWIRIWDDDGVLTIWIYSVDFC